MAGTTLTDRAVVRLSGEDVRAFVQGLVTSDVGGPLPVWAGLLTPQGKCLFDFMVWDDGEDLLLDCEAAAVDDLIKRLAIYRLRRAIRIARDERLAVHWSRDGEGTPDPRLRDLGRRWLAAAGSLRAGWLEHRLRLGVCEGRAELGDLLWLECNAAELNGVSFSKGCFIGPGEYRADELAAEGQSPAVRDWRWRRPSRGSNIRKSAFRSSMRASTPSPTMPSFPNGSRARSLSPARHKRARERSPCRGPWAGRRRNGSLRRAGCQGPSYARRSEYRRRAAWCEPAARGPAYRRCCCCRSRPAPRHVGPASPPHRRSGMRGRSR